MCLSFLNSILSSSTDVCPCLTNLAIASFGPLSPLGKRWLALTSFEVITSQLHAPPLQTHPHLAPRQHQRYAPFLCAHTAIILESLWLKAVPPQKSNAFFPFPGLHRNHIGLVKKFLGMRFCLSRWWEWVSRRCSHSHQTRGQYTLKNDCCPPLSRRNWLQGFCTCDPSHLMF